MLNVALWLLYFIPALLIEIMCFFFAPLVACFIRTEPRYDVVKRLNKRSVLMQRDYLIKPLYWFQTHDNAVDEWWYGMYNTDHWFAFARNWTQADYDASRFIRWYCRVMWLWRNCAYGFHYNLFSRPKEYTRKTYNAGIEGKGLWLQLDIFESSFQLQCHVPWHVLVCINLCLTSVLFILNYQCYFIAASLGVSNYVAYKALHGRYLTINVGWKSHKSMPRLLYANRIIGFRKYENA